MPRKPTPEQVAEARVARLTEDYILDGYMARRDYLSEYVARQQKTDSFIAGDWAVEFPDGRVVHDKPKIENAVISKIEDTGGLTGNGLPTIRVEPRDERDYNNSQEREKAILNYWSQSELPLILPRLAMDMIGMGMCAMKVWPDFRVKDPAMRFPQYKRLDPRHILPPLDYVIEGDIEPSDVIVHKYVKIRNLARQYPQQAAEIQRVAEKIAMSANRGKRQGQPNVVVDTSQVLVVEYWGREGIVHLAMVDGYPETNVVLLSEENPLECVPIVLGVRPTADGRIRGKVESMMPALAAENRLVTYVLDYADQMVFAPIKKRGTVQNAEDFGPGAIIDLGPDGDIGRVDPAHSNPQLFQIISDLERHAKRGGNQSDARVGDVKQSIVSGAGIEAMQGTLVTEVQGYNVIFESMLRRANSIAIKEDVHFCNGRKEVSGMGKSGGYVLKYTPAELFKDGKFSDNYVSYGAASGLDKSNAEVRIDQRARSGYVSRRYVRENIDGIPNVTAEEERILDEAALAALVQGIFAAAANGDMGPLSAFMEVRKRHENPILALHEIAAAATQQAAQGGGQPGPAAMPTTAQADATALSSGALPGTEESLPAVDAGSLPPVAQTVMAG